MRFIEFIARVKIAFEYKLFYVAINTRTGLTSFRVTIIQVTGQGASRGWLDRYGHPTWVLAPRVLRGDTPSGFVPRMLVILAC
jgi:hypothetical protein